MKQRSDLKILLMQIREDTETIQEEFLEFVQYSELREEQFTILNVFDTPDFDPSIIEGYDALFVGGSSDATVLKPQDYPFVEAAKRLLRYCYDHHIPVFASCFGFQVVVIELGGQVSLDKINMEMGMFKIELTSHAKTDLLLFDMPDKFWAVSGHQERAIEMPEQANLMAMSQQCPYHIVKFHNRPFYAFQFHPEMSCADLRARITRYQNRYLADEAELQHILDTAVHESPEANSLLTKFVDRIILEQIPEHYKDTYDSTPSA